LSKNEPPVLIKLFLLKKVYCALGLELRVRIRARVSGNAFSVKCVFERM